MKTNLYWNVYKSLERELLMIADIIHIDDSQLNMYSMKIADLLIRTCVEIESISKELYFMEGGTKPDDNNLFFDTDCLALLESKWQLSKKVVMISNSNLYLTEENNIYLTPLHKSFKRGSSSSDWLKAYQAIKHNRVKSLSKGNLKHLIRSMGALYLLNIYYRNPVIKLDNDCSAISFEANVGSSIFSIEFLPFEGFTKDGNYFKPDDYDKYTFLILPTEESKDKFLQISNKIQDEILNVALKLTEDTLVKEADAVVMLPQKELEARILATYESKKQELYTKLPPKDRKIYLDAHKSIKYELVLNTNQF